MEDSFQKKLDNIKNEAPTTVKADPIALVYGAVFIGLGAWLIDLGNDGFGILMIIVGIVGILAGGLTFIWKSPKVKIIQAVDSFLIAIILLAFVAGGDGEGIFKNPLLVVALSAFMIWAGYDDLKEYWTLEKGRK